MLLSDIQPQYFPRLHYFARMLASDMFVIRDDVQFVRNHKFPDGRRDVSYQAHSPMPSSDGTSLLSVSVKKSGPLPINSTFVSYDQQWVKKHINVIKNTYSKSPYFKKLIPGLELLFKVNFETISELNIATLCWGMNRLLGNNQLSTEYLSLSHINYLIERNSSIVLQRILLGTEHLSNTDSDTASERIVRLCQLFAAEEYMTGGTAHTAYLDTGVFQRKNIRISIQDWKCQTYPQQHSNKGQFVQNLSIIDLLMNCSPEEALSILLPMKLS